MDNLKTNNKNKGKNTLLWSIFMSSYGPIILGIGLVFGRSNTQIADFIRRSVELLVMIISYISYTIIQRKGYDETQRENIERKSNFFVGIAMVLVALIMIFLTLFSNNDTSGNVTISFVIACLGLFVNTIFWFRYTKLAKEENSNILGTQAKLYRAKSFVDFCVTISLLSLFIVPTSSLSCYLDVFGSLIVAVYLAYSGAKIMIKKINK